MTGHEKFLVYISLITVLEETVYVVAYAATFLCLCGPYKQLLCRHI